MTDERDDIPGPIRRRFSNGDALTLGCLGTAIVAIVGGTGLLALVVGCMLMGMNGGSSE